LQRDETWAWLSCLFDALEYANILKETAVPDEQAQAQTKALRHALEVALSECAAIV